MRVREKTTHPAQRRVPIVLGWLRIGLAAAEVVALIGNLQYVLGFSAFGVGNFFGYFTVQSAMVAVPVLVVGGIVLLDQRAESRAFITVRTIVLVYVLLSGIVFGLLAVFSTTRTYQIAIPWSDQLLHFVIPAGMLADWIAHRFLGPRSPAVPWTAVGWAVPFPIAWLAFTVIRGEAVGWYPYFFLDPSQVDGTAAIVAYCAVVLLMILGFTALFVGVSRLRSLESAAVARAPRAEERADTDGLAAIRQG